MIIHRGKPTLFEKLQLGDMYIEETKTSIIPRKIYIKVSNFLGISLMAIEDTLFLSSNMIKYDFFDYLAEFKKILPLELNKKTKVFQHNWILIDTHGDLSPTPTLLQVDTSINYNHNIHFISCNRVYTNKVPHVYPITIIKD